MLNKKIRREGCMKQYRTIATSTKTFCILTILCCFTQVLGYIMQYDRFIKKILLMKGIRSQNHYLAKGKL
jgi:hypothetical protein